MHQWIRLTLTILCAFGLLLGIQAAEDTLTIASQAPGNIVTSATPLVFTVQGAAETVRYHLTDYFGQQCATGTVTAQNGVATIKLPTLVPGYYGLTCTSGERQATVSLGVLIDRGNAPLPRNGRICSDVAMAALVDAKNYKPLAHIIRMAGIPWVRERMSWSAVEKTRGKYTWSGNPYQAVLDSYAAEGIYVQQLSHDAPQWARPDRKGAYDGPDDLRDVYRFAKTAAAKYKGKIAAWEMWNESDGATFWYDLSDRFAGYEKACYLGLKDGNPTIQAFPGSMTYWFTPEYGRRLFQSIPGYGDGYNWHYYTWSDQTVPEKAYAKTLSTKAPYLQNTWMAGKPIRLTEVGILLKGEKETGRLSADDQRKQCQFMPRMAACGIAAGNEKLFNFVLPEYFEGAVYQFASLRKDLTPNPAFPALSAAANLIGESNYLGQYYADAGVLAFAFSTPRGNVLVAWSDNAAKLTVPTELASVRVANIFGAAQPNLTAQQGAVTLTVGPDATYLIGIGNAIVSKLEKPTPVKPAPAVTPSRVVVVGHDDRSLKLDRATDSYILDKTTENGELAPFTYQVEVYNFDRQKQRGTVALEIPDGWAVEPKSQSVTVTPMGREICNFTVTPKPFQAMGNIINVAAKFGKIPVAPSFSYFVVRGVALNIADNDPAAPCRRETLPANAIWLDSLDLTAMSSGFQTAQAMKSVMGTPLTLNGIVYPHGVGTHAKSVLELELGGAFAGFTSMVGVDGEVAGNGSVQFMVIGDGKVLADSGIMRGSEAAKLLTANLTGVRHLTLVVDNGDGDNSYDHADWAGAFFTYDAKAEVPPKIEVTTNVAKSLAGDDAPAQAIWLDSLDISSMTSGYKTAQAGKSVEGNPLTVGGMVFKHGVGTHAESTYTLNLHGAAVKFQSVVGVDGEMGGEGSVQFLLIGDGKLLADSGIIKAGQLQLLSADLTGVQQLVMNVTSGGDGSSYDHADWAGAVIFPAPKQ